MSSYTRFLILPNFCEHSWHSYGLPAHICAYEMHTNFGLRFEFFSGNNWSRTVSRCCYNLRTLHFYRYVSSSKYNRTKWPYVPFCKLISPVWSKPTFLWYRVHIMILHEQTIKNWPKTNLLECKCFRK